MFTSIGSKISSGLAVLTLTISTALAQSDLPRYANAIDAVDSLGRIAAECVHPRFGRHYFLYIDPNFDSTQRGQTFKIYRVEGNERVFVEDLPFAINTAPRPIDVCWNIFIIDIPEIRQRAEENRARRAAQEQ